MRRVILFGLMAMMSLAACESKAPDENGGARATGFITANTPPPASAADSRNDGVPRDADGRPFSYALLGEKLPQLKGQMADGTVFDAASLRGWTVIDVWGIWCGDCMADAPYVDALARAIAADPDLQFLSVHVPANQTRVSAEEMFGKYGSVAAYFKAKGYAYPTLVDTDGSLRETLKVSWTPSYLIVSPDGIVRGFRTDLSAAGGDPVKDFMRDIARVRSEVKRAALSDVAAPPVIGPDGAMRLTGETPFTLEAVKLAFPGRDIVANQAAENGAPFPVFEIRTPPAAGIAGSVLYVVEPDWTRGYVASVRAVSPEVTGPDGGRIGTLRLSALAPSTRLSCSYRDDKAAADAAIICNAAGGRFTRRFGAGADFKGSLRAAGVAARENAVLLEMRFDPPVPSAEK
jgi:thiol-disulfide isomerase/thioredoxin